MYNENVALYLKCNIWSNSNSYIVCHQSRIYFYIEN